MRVAVCTNTDNGCGLERDFAILKRLVEAEGHEVTGVHHRGAKPAERFDLVIFAETYVHGWMDLAPRRWMCPNAEWWFADWNEQIAVFDWILCKTRDAETLFQSMGGRTVFTGFEAEDRLDAAQPRQRRFLHIAGESLLKGTQEVVDAWVDGKLTYPLTIVARKFKIRKRSKHVEILGRMEEADLRALQNRCLFHLQPSQYEGFGHVIHEGLSVGALVLTTKAPWSSGVKGLALQMEPSESGLHQIATLTKVSAESIRQAAETVWGFDDAKAHQLCGEARLAYDLEVAAFRATFVDLLRSITPSQAQEVRAPVSSMSTGLDPVAVNQPRVCIVLPTHHSWAPIVLRTVLALRWQTVDSFEVVIVADGGDPEGALEAVAVQGRRPDLPGQSVRVRVVSSPRPRGDHPHRNHARNAGWRASTVAPDGLCWMLDCDFILPPHAVEHLLHEHDAAKAAGAPAVFTPCLAGVGDINAADWLKKSQTWVSTSRREDFEAALDCGGISPAFAGYPDCYTGPDVPRSAILANLPEGMPIVWRGLLVALEGFDEGFGEWGGDKEEFTDRVKGCARSGLFDVKLLTSVMALHQPHVVDPAMPANFNNPSPEVKARWAERERRQRMIASLATWWRPRLERVRLAAPSFLGGAGQIELPPTPGELDPADQDAPEVLVEIVAHARRIIQSQGEILILGRWRNTLANILLQRGARAKPASLPELEVMPDRAYREVVILDLLADENEERMRTVIDSIRRVVGQGASIYMAERTKMNTSNPSNNIRSPLDYQRALPGLAFKSVKMADGAPYTIFTGRLVR